MAPSRPDHGVDPPQLARILAAIATMPPSRQRRWVTTLARILDAPLAEATDPPSADGPRQAASSPSCDDPAPGEGR